jgi:hypothetical protein
MILVHAGEGIDPCWNWIERPFPIGRHSASIDVACALIHPALELARAPASRHRSAKEMSLPG